MTVIHKLPRIYSKRRVSGRGVHVALVDYNIGMQKVLIYTVAALLTLGILVIGMLWLMTPHVSNTAPGTNTKPATSSGGGQTTVTPGSGGQTAPVGQGIMLGLEGGGSIQVSDFKNDSATVNDTNNPGHYYLSGGLDPTTNNASHSTFYAESDQSFNITLLKEPIGEVRKQAETELMQKLAISQADMCRLHYWVGVPNFVNSIYSGKNLGFSFCPGATPL